MNFRVMEHNQRPVLDSMPATMLLQIQQCKMQSLLHSGLVLVHAHDPLGMCTVQSTATIACRWLQCTKASSRTFGVYLSKAHPSK